MTVRDQEPAWRLVVRETPAECAEEAVGIIAAALRGHPAPVLGVATGSTPLPTYEALARQRVLGLDVQLVLLDEYVGLRSSDRRSFTSTIDRHLATPLGIPRSHILAPPHRRWRAASGCRRFETRIADLGGVDIQLLGIGRNGHIGFNEPGSPLDSRTRLVELAPTTVRDNRHGFDREVDVPQLASTQGIGTILEARQLLLLATGAHKSSILRAALEGPITPEVPASALRLHSDVVIVADAAAAGTLGAER